MSTAQKRQARVHTEPMSASGVALDRVIAVVNDGIVLQSQLDTQTALIGERLRGQGTQLPPADVIRQQVLERLILQEIQVQRANRLGVQVSDETLNEALRDVAKRNNIPFEQMPVALEQQGLDYATYREEMRREIMAGGCGLTFPNPLALRFPWISRARSHRASAPRGPRPVRSRPATLWATPAPAAAATAKS